MCMRASQNKKKKKNVEEEVMFDYKKGIKVLFLQLLLLLLSFFYNYIYRVDESDRISTG